MTPLKGCRCECPTCLERFGSVRAFDRHRIGEYRAPGALTDTRRCLTLAQMLAAGWHRNARGFLLMPDPRRTVADCPLTPATVPEHAGDDVQGRRIALPATTLARAA